jgi:hypothetical protein
VCDSKNMMKHIGDINPSSPRKVSAPGDKLDECSRAKDCHSVGNIATLDSTIWWSATRSVTCG